MKILKNLLTIIILVLATLLFFGLGLAYTDIYLSGEYLARGWESADMPGMIFLAFGCLVITLAEFVRMIRKKKRIILPMLGMYAVVFLATIALTGICQVASGDRSYLGMAFTMTLMTVLVIVAIWGSRYAQVRGISTSASANRQVTFLSKFEKFSAEWYWDDILQEYERLYGSTNPEDLDHHEVDDEVANKIYIYACGYFAYLFEWLLVRDGLSENKLTLTRLKKKQENPAEFIYNYMDGTVCREDIKPEYWLFLDAYYERLSSWSNGAATVRTTSYGLDYDNVILDSQNGGSEILWCREFDWEKYHIFERLLDERYEMWSRDYMVDDLVPFEPSKTTYSHSLEMEMDVNVQLVNEAEKEAFDQYVQKCIAEVDQIPEPTFQAICNAFNAWGEEWVSGLTPETFKKAVSGGEIQVLKPYGPELAYILAFEADFEEEHGIAVVIRDGKVIWDGYRMDAESPWCSRMEKVVKDESKG